MVAALNALQRSRVTQLWALCGMLVVAGAATFSWYSHYYNYDYRVIEMSIPPMAASLILLGIFFVLIVPALIHKSQREPASDQRTMLGVMIFAGLAMRLVLLPSEPILEDDYQRYLLDGAMVAHGYNPFSISPSDLLQLDPSTPLGALVADGGYTVGRVNHPELRTIYPPVTQAWFAIAHLISPWDIVAWRLVLLALEGATLALIIVLLGEIGKSPLWAALYWWNPLVLKELANSAHMEPVILAPLMLALLLAVRGRNVWASASLALAAGAKIWPVLLLPLILRPLIKGWPRLFTAIAIFAGLSALFALPVLITGLDPNSGFHAYASRWQTNSALFLMSKGMMTNILETLNVTVISPGLAARLFAASILGLLVLWVIRSDTKDADDLIGRASLVVAALVLLAPAQFPWYMTWFAPFLVFRPWTGMLLMAITLPIYYLSFHYNSRDQADIYRHVIVFGVWVPIWAALIWDIARNRHSALKPV